jgi:hypothetical protein
MHTLKGKKSGYLRTLHFNKEVFKKIKIRTGGVAQLVECLPSKHETNFKAQYGGGGGTFGIRGVAQVEHLLYKY